jgi:hypothetical protein
LRLAATGVRGLTAIADRGYFKGEEILACEAAGVTPIVPKPLTSGAKADGRFGKQDFVYDPGADVYRCPAGETLTWRYSGVEEGFEGVALDVDVRRGPARASGAGMVARRPDNNRRL